ncbi:MAG: hypothetical protein HY360_15165 [Verrucomicrobia bacterium]|nr:hypothetical protein [Verrucomicrobiota bacterium]
MRVQWGAPGSRLQAKALALSSGSRRALMVALDLVFIPAEHCVELRQAISQHTALRPEEIIISATHSHSTPFLEPLAGEHPLFDFIKSRSLEAALTAWDARRPARFGQGITYIAGASFNTQVRLPNGGVKFTRDFREGLAAGRPIDPRLNVIRIDDQNGKPIAGWIRFAAHPACVIFNAPLSGEYPGYMTERVSETVATGAPVLFGLGACGDVNCIPMFGMEKDSKDLGLNLANAAAQVFKGIQTAGPRRFVTGSRTIELPLDPPPPVELLEREIAEVEAFIAALDKDPSLEWVLGFNCKKDWSVEDKKGSVRPLAEWAQRMREAIQAGRKFPATWPSEVNVWVIDDLGLVFYSGEPFTEFGLTLAARSPLRETLLMAMSNGSDGYIGLDESRRHGGYEMYTAQRYAKLAPGARPLPYALGAGEHLTQQALDLINKLPA